MSVADNLILGREDKRSFSYGRFFLDYSTVKMFAKEMILYFDIKTTGLNALIQYLSGGNQQKVILAREFTSDPAVIIASQPTRGLDLKTVNFIYQKFKEERELGKAILLISYDLEEILELSDRIGVINDGRIQIFPREEAEVNEIGKMMVGIKNKNDCTEKQNKFSAQY